MKLCVFDDWRIGVVEGDAVVDVTGALPPSLAALPRQRMTWLAAQGADGLDAIASHRSNAPAVPLERISLRAPIPAPAHVFAAPANYRRHIGELGERAVTRAGRTAREQGFFLKAPGSVSGPADGIVLPIRPGRRFDHESELAVVIGRGGRNIRRGDAMAHVFGYSCLVDVTMRIEPGIGEEERSMRKSFATFTPLGPWLTTADEIVEPERLRNRLWVGDDLRQDATTADLIVGIGELIELVSAVLPLSPGDVIATGTPEGVGPISAGDRVRIEIDGLGSMVLDVRSGD